MKKLLGFGLLCSMVLGSAAFAAENADDDDRGSIGKKGSVLVFPKVEVRYDVATGLATMDTFIQISNDGDHSVYLKLWFVNGDDWCYFVDDTGLLTINNPIYWSVDTGAPGPTAGGGGAFQSFRFVQEPIVPPATDDGILRGFIVAYATTADEIPVCWNHLTGKATIVNYATADAVEYEAYAFAGLGSDCDDNEDALPLEDLVEHVTGGSIALNGVDYDNAPDALLMDFFAEDAAAPVLGESGANSLSAVSTELTLLLLDMDFTSQTAATVAAIDHRIYNENEQHRTFSGNDCIECWSSRLLTNIVAQYRRSSLSTDKGKSTISSKVNIWCPIRYCHEDDTLPANVNTTDRAIVGVQTTTLSFGAAGSGAAAVGLVGCGIQPAGAEPEIVFSADRSGGAISDVREALSDDAP